ncbi:hypothetical protein [Nevskia soli]|uniref:hypothetical protein n=1 Tax=Nevskia soli TaxID=418856 RepID=UPI0012F94D2A|nr:hypothetical protein [Nevskia soli]
MNQDAVGIHFVAATAPVLVQRKEIGAQCTDSTQATIDAAMRQNRSRPYGLLPKSCRAALLVAHLVVLNFAPRALPDTILEATQR